jgi:hypothetical protein
MSAEIFSFPAPGTSRIRVRRQARAAAAQAEPELTVTAKNSRLRRDMDADWRAIDATRAYWRAVMDMENAIGDAQRNDLPEGKNHPPHDHDNRMVAVRKWRAAIVAQLLTPAPYARAVVWKRAALKGRQHCHTDVKTERIERAIADDVAWLAAHPTRTKKGGHDEAPAPIA